MIDIYKYSKKNKIYEFIILKILKINVQLLTKPLFLNFNLNIDIDEKFFYEYREKYPITKWMEMEEVSKFYQSNHEGEIIDTIHDERHWAHGIIINPGAFTHYSYAINQTMT